MREIYFVSVFLHILSAAIWVGGMIFLVIVLIPAIKNHPEKAMLIHSTGVKFRTVGWIALFLLLITGLYNMHVRNFDFSFSGLIESRFGKMILFKLIIFTITVLSSAIHDFYIGTKATELWMHNIDASKIKKFRAWARWAGRLNLILALIAIGIGIAIVRGY